MPDDSFDVSIVVPAVGDRRSTEADLAVAERAAARGRSEIVVTGITDARLIGEVRTRLPQALLIVPAAAIPAAEARKRGAAAARGDTLAIVDRRRVVPARWIGGPEDGEAALPVERRRPPRLAWLGRSWHRAAVSPSPAAAAPSGDGKRHTAAAWACLSRGDEDGAILHFRQAIADGHQPPQVAAGLANVLVRQERLDEADRLFQDVVRRWPENPSGHVGRTRVLQSRQCRLAALDAWKALAERFPQSREAFFGIAEALVGLGRFEEAESLFQDGAERWPEATAPLAGLARAAADSGRHRLACDRWQEALARFPGDLLVRTNCVRSLLDAVGVEEARRVYEGAPPESRTPIYRCVLADIHAATYDWPTVLETLREIVHSAPHDLEVALREAMLLVRVARYTSDPIHLERAVTLWAGLVGEFPHSLKARVALAEGYVMARRDDDAIRVIDRLPNDRVGHKALVTLKAWRQARDGDTEGAKRTWRAIERGHYLPAIHAPPGTFRRLDDRPIDPAQGEVLLFTAIRNEAWRLPWFLDTYRKLGVGRFVVVDNDSTDGGGDFLVAQDDVHVFHTTDSYARAWSGMRWINELVERHGAGHWCLYVDVDERLVYPGVEEAGLASLLAWMERRGHEAFRAFMLDMHGPTGGHRPECRPGDDPLALFPFFDAVHHCFGEPNCPYRHVTGGVRRRDGNTYFLTKTPIIRGGGSIRFLSSSHHTTPAAVSDVTGALLHFKLAGAPAVWTAADIGDRLPGCVRRHRHDSVFGRSDERDVPLVGASTVRYQSSRQLVALGLIDCPEGFLSETSPTGTFHAT